MAMSREDVLMQARKAERQQDNSWGFSEISTITTDLDWQRTVLPADTCKIDEYLFYYHSCYLFLNFARQ